MKNHQTQKKSIGRGKFPGTLLAGLAAVIILLGLLPAGAANLLLNPGFEEGQVYWNTAIRGGTAVVYTNAAEAHSGSCYISNYNSGGWSSASQGDARGGWTSGSTLNVSDLNFYKLTGWVKLPTGASNPKSLTLRYRFETSGNRVDVGTKLIDTANWTYLESAWIQPAPGDYFMSYFEVHSVDNAVAFLADDMALEESVPMTVNGRVVDSLGNGVDNANVLATSAAYNSPAAITAGGGYYSITVPSGTYKIAANSPGFKGSINLNVTATPTTAPNIVLAVDPDYDAELIFNARSTDIVSGQPWPTVNPAGGSMSRIGTPLVKSFGGVQYSRHDADGPGYLLGTYTSPIPVNGASIVVIAKPKRKPSGDWDSVVDVFYDRLVLGIRNDTGVVNVRRLGSLDFSGVAIPENQTTVLSLVVQPDGAYKVWANGAEIMSIPASASPMTELVPNVPGTYANAINVGRNNPDGWTTFNGFIGDVYLYNVAITDTKRQALEASLLNKFVTNATLTYTITATAGANGSISSPGATSVLQGTDKTYTMTGNAGYVVSNVVVDGLSVGPVTTYTFANVSAPHTIDVQFQSLPPQTITATAGANGSISPSGGVSVPAGNNQTFTIVPNSGYAVAEVLVDGVSQGEIYKYTFNFVTAPHTIAVTFRQLSMNIPLANEILFSAVSQTLPGDALPLTAPWKTYVPSNQNLVILGAPTSLTVSGTAKTNIWASNLRETFDGYRYEDGRPGGEYTSPIPVAGATIVCVAQPMTGLGVDPWDSIVDIFYNRLTLGIRNSDGAVYARVNGTGQHSTDLIPSGQTTVLSMVVQQDGSYKVWANTAQIMTGAGPALTSLVPGTAPWEHYINVGRNNPDGWTSFNGLIGDVFVYKTALSDAQRQQVENILMTKFEAPLPPTYRWAGPNNGNWSTPANWNNNIPGIGNTATFSDSASAGQTVQLDTAVTVAGLVFNNLVANSTIASTAGNALTLDNGVNPASVYADAGAHTITAPIDLPVGIAKTGPGKVTLAGNAGGSSVGGFGWNAGPGIGMRVSGPGSELVLAGTAPMLDTRGTTVSGGGKLTITGTYTTSGYDQIIGDAGQVGEIVLSGNGSWTHSGGGVLVIGNDQPSCIGKITINGNATLNRPGEPIWMAVGWAGGSQGIIEQNGGLVTPVQVAAPWRTSYGPGIMLGQWANSVCHATYSLNGGVLQTPSIGNVAFVGDVTNGVVVPPSTFGGSATLNLNGGTLRASTDDQTDADAVAEGTAHLIFNTTHTWVKAGGAKIETAYSNSIAVSLEHDASGPALDGGLTKLGTGTLVLLKASTYTGPTKVQAGTLVCKLGTALGGGAVDISTGAKLQLDYAGTRVVSQLTYNNGAPLPAGTYGATGSGAANINDTYFAGTGTLTVGSLTPPTLGAGSITVSGGIPSFTFATTVGYKYRLVYKATLTDATWTPVTVPAPDGWTTATGASLTLTDTTATGQPTRFYRVEVGL